MIDFKDYDTLDLLDMTHLVVALVRNDMRRDASLHGVKISLYREFKKWQDQTPDVRIKTGLATLKELGHEIEKRMTHQNEH